MTSAFSKLDVNLRTIYQSYVAEKREAGAMPEPAPEEELLFVLVQHIGNLPDLELAGLKNAASYGDNLAGGYVSVENLVTLAELPSVVRIDHRLDEDEPLIESSVPEVLADQVWTLNRTTGVFSGTGQTGEGVIIGIIDSGIDINHPDFFKQTSPTKQTRILRIWDQGLDPTGTEHSPALSLLAPSTTTTYGVEWTDGDINTHLNGGATVRHKDCNGHGTHVASIAAGNGKADGLPLEHVGVAPKADLVIVKFFNPEKANPPPGGQRFIDAVHYIDNVVRTQLGNKPCVINYSGGSSLGPHDGLTSQELFLTNHFRGKQRRVMVVAAGNNGNARRHGRITIPPAGTIDVPFTLSDSRVVKTDHKHCAEKSNTFTLFVDLYYPDIAGVNVRVKLPTSATFLPTAGPLARGDPNLDHTFDGGKKVKLFHDAENAVRPAEPAPLSLPAVTVNRSNIQLQVTAAADLFATGDYVLRLAGPPGTEIHAWCNSGTRHGFKLGAVLPAGVDVLDDDILIGSPAGARHILSVAAYDDTNGAIASFSSRGGLMDYASVGNFPNKPELSAPGVKISAALSDFSLIPALWGFTIPGHTLKDGTSMSAPHASGAVALMMQKKNNLTVPEALQILTTAGQGVRAQAPQKQFGAGKLDARGAVTNTP